MPRWADVGRGDLAPTLAARIEAAVAGAGVVSVETVFRAGEGTSLVTTYRAPRHTLEAVTRAIAASRVNARVVVTPGAEFIEWVTSEPLDH